MKSRGCSLRGPIGAMENNTTSEKQVKCENNTDGTGTGVVKHSGRIIWIIYSCGCSAKVEARAVNDGNRSTEGGSGAVKDGSGAIKNRSGPVKNAYGAGSQAHTIKFNRYYIGTDSVTINKPERAQSFRAGIGTGAGNMALSHVNTFTIIIGTGTGNSDGRVVSSKAFIHGSGTVNIIVK
jgi:hypothetical protein